MGRSLGKWTQDQLTRAMNAVLTEKWAVRRAAATFGIPRRTLRNHIASNNFTKVTGRHPVLSLEQELQLCKRIHRLPDVGMPVTPKFIKRTVYTFCAMNSIKNPFNDELGTAGRKWFKLFMQRHPDISKRKAQNLNPARAQKLNRFIVNDYFDKLKSVMLEIGVMQKPQSIYNVDEKGNPLCLHKAPVVLARKGATRVHNIASEHGQNVTIVSCGNALGQVIPPIILFKGKRMRPEWAEDLPPGSQILMTPKGSMNTQTFVKWLDHFARYKAPGPALLIFDGVSSHLDANIVAAADAHEVTLFCLPSNTTHELQPMDKSVFRAYETYWDDEVLLLWTQQARNSAEASDETGADRVIRKRKFGKIFSRAWAKAATPSNVVAGFKATGIYPFDPSAIKDEAFAPSEVTERPHQMESGNPVFNAVSRKPQKPLKRKLAYRESDSSVSDSDYSVHDSPSDDLSFSDYKIAKPGNQTGESPTFHDILQTPKASEKKMFKPRKKAINYRAQKVLVSLFEQEKNVNVEPKGKENYQQKNEDDKIYK